MRWEYLPWELWLIGVFVGVVAGAAEENIAAVSESLAGHQVPHVVRRAEAGGVDVGVELDVLHDALLLSCLLEVVEDVFCWSNWLGRFPDLPGEAKGVHVAVGPDPGVLEEVPGAAEVGAPLQDDILGPFAVFLEVVGRVEPADAGPNDDAVCVLLVRHIQPRVHKLQFKRLHSGVKLFIESKAPCMSCEIFTPEGRGGEKGGRECKFPNKAHKIFHPRNTFSPAQGDEVCQVAPG